MPTTSAHYQLSLFDNSNDLTTKFLDFRNLLAGTSSNSNMVMIDTALYNLAQDVATLKQNKQMIRVSATNVVDNYTFSASGIASITSYDVGLIIALSLNITNLGTATLNINGLGSRSLMKFDYLGGFVNLDAGDIKLNRIYIFMYDGTRWVLVTASTADQVASTGAPGAIVTVGEFGDLSGSVEASDGLRLGTNDISADVDGTSIILSGVTPNKVIAHADTSTQVSITNTGSTVVQSIGVDDYGHVTSMSGTSLAPNPNLLTNGNFVVGQRYAASTLITVPNGGSIFGADRWRAYRGGTVGGSSIGRYPATSDPNGLTNIMTFNRTSGSTGTQVLVLGQDLETIDSIPLRGKYLTFTANVAKEVGFAGTVYLIITYGTGTDQNMLGGFTGATVIANGAFTSTQLGTISVTTANPVPTAATQINVQIQYAPSQATAPANDTIYILGAKLEIGQQFTGWVFPSYQETLAKCMRYYERIPQIGSNTPYFHLVPAFMATTTSAQGVLNYQPKRIAPNISSGGTWIVLLFSGGSSALSGGITGDNMAISQGKIIATASTALTAQNTGWIRANNDVNAYVALDAEL